MQRKQLQQAGFWLVILCSVIPALGMADGLRSSELSPKQALGRDLAYYEDASARLQLDQVAALPDAAWQRTQADVPSFGYSTSAYWYRLTLWNDTPVTDSRLLALGYPLLDSVQFFLLDEQGLQLRRVNTGDALPFDTREINHRHFLFDLTLRPGEQRTVYLRVWSEGAQQVPLALWHKDTFFTEDTATVAAKSVYYGMLVIMVLYNLFIWVSLKQRPYIYYVFLEASFVLLLAATHGFLYQYAWSGSPWLQEKALLVLIPLFLLFSNLFTIDMLSLKRRYRRFYWLLRTFVYMNIASIVGAFLFSYYLSTTTSLISTAVQCLAMMCIGLFLWRQGQREARYFSIAWILFFAGNLLAVLNKASVVPVNFLTENAILLGSVAEALFLSFALADRFHLERAARYRAQKARLEEIKQRRSVEKRMLYRSTHNMLTSLPNRPSFAQFMERMLPEYQHKEGGLALVLLQLSHFAEVNKTFGFVNGSRLLKEVAVKITHEARRQETALSLEHHHGVPICVGHVEGTTFALLFECSDRAATLVQLRQFVGILGEPYSFNNTNIDVGVQAGVAFFPEHGESVDELVRNAHVAVEIGSFRNSKLAVFDEGMNPYSQRRLALIADLNQALERDALSLHFQPQIDIASGQVLGAEALLRWQHDEYGTVPPDEFIPLAERSGMIKRVTRWVIEHSLATCKWLREAGFNDFVVSANVSTLNLREDHFAERVVALLEKYQLPAQALKLEVTESAMMDETFHAFGELSKLHQAGIRMSMDDFGTGYSSLSYIRKLPVKEIKIDRSFVMGMLEEKDDEIIVRATIHMCHDLGYRVVAEGVENRQVLRQLELMQCDAAQGFHIARPMPADDFLDWLTEHSRMVASSQGRA